MRMCRHLPAWPTTAVRWIVQPSWASKLDSSPERLRDLTGITLLGVCYSSRQWMCCNLNRKRKLLTTSWSPAQRTPLSSGLPLVPLVSCGGRGPMTSRLTVDRSVLALEPLWRGAMEVVALLGPIHSRMLGDSGCGDLVGNVTYLICEFWRLLEHNKSVECH